MKIVAFSDLHVHPHKFGDVIGEDGRSRRLQDCIDVLEWTANLANDVGAPLRLFCGDLFHVRGKLTPSALNPVVEHFSMMSKVDGPATLMIPGNHDMESRSAEVLVDGELEKRGEHALDAIGAIHGVGVLNGHGFRVHTIPAEGDMVHKTIGIGWVSYDPSVDEIKRRIKKVAAQRRNSLFTGPTVFMLHHGVDGALAGVPECGLAAKHLPYEDFDFVLCGDYHNHKELVPGKAWMIGAPLQHNFGDTGQRRGVLVLDTDTKTAEFVENTAAPKFLHWDDGPFSMMPAVADNFVCVRADTQERLDAMRDEAAAAGARAVMRDLVKDWKAVGGRAEMMLGMSTSQMFRSWIGKQVLDPDIAVDQLVALNDDLLSEAGVS